MLAVRKRAAGGGGMGTWWFPQAGQVAGSEPGGAAQSSSRSSADGQESVKPLNFLVSPPAPRRRARFRVTVPPVTAEGAFEGEALRNCPEGQTGEAGRLGCGCSPSSEMESTDAVQAPPT